MDNLETPPLRVAVVPGRDNTLAVPANLPRTRREPAKGWAWPKLRELWEYRELLFFFAWRDIKVRYKQTVMGALWAIIQPFFTMVIFSLFFGRLANVPSDGLPYPIFSYAALVPWTFFANALTQASNSLVLSANMIKKIYFPRLALPIATVLAGVVDFVLAFMVLLGMMLFYGLVPTLNILWLPLFLLLALVTSLGVSLWLSAMNVQFRDVHYTIPFLTQAWLFVTPIAYPSSLLSGTLADLVWAESDGRGGRGFSLGLAGHRYGAWAHDDRLCRGSAGPVRQRRLLFPADGTEFCGCACR